MKYNYGRIWYLVSTERFPAPRIFQLQLSCLYWFCSRCARNFEIDFCMYCACLAMDTVSNKHHRWKFLSFDYLSSSHLYQFWFTPNMAIPIHNLYRSFQLWLRYILSIHSLQREITPFRSSSVVRQQHNQDVGKINSEMGCDKGNRK